MAAFLPANPGAAGRRKKLVTYGKSARLSMSAPQLSDDAPLSDEGGALKGVEGKPKTDRAETLRAATKSPDIFDVPSEDEFAPPRPTSRPTSRPGSKPTSRPAKSRIHGRETATHKTTQPLRNSDAVNPVAPAAKQPAKLVASPTPSSSSTAIRRAKTPQVAQSAIQDKTNTKAVQRSAAKPGDAPRTTQKLAKGPVKGSAKQSADLDLFDVPSSDEETAPNVLSQRSAARPKHTAPPSASIPRKELPESDESNASRSRKRKPSVSVAATKPAGAVEELSLPQRGRKYQKKAEDASPGHVLNEQPVSKEHHVSKEQHVSKQPVSKQTVSVPPASQRKARIRTAPALTKAALAKGQSSPASLGMMIPKTPAIEDKAVDDETMYEILDSSVTPMRKSLGSTPGSVTPRQKDLFHGLLGESASKTPMPPMSSLQLSDKKPRSLLGALARSKSDLTHSAQSRKTSLIHTLKREETSSDDSESEEETVDDDVQEARRSPPSNRMDADTENDTQEAQTSQSSVTAGRSRLTYAKSRSYLQESNFEDELLISMDLDEDIKFSSQNKGDSGTEDEEDPASQVRGHHELKKQGQYDMFYWDTEASIDDMSNTSKNSIRRSVMIEFCTKMADRKFVAQLLDSSLFQRFLESMTSNGDAVFDFAAAGAVIFILQTDPPYSVLEQICRSDVKKTMIKLLDNDSEIWKITKDRKTNASRIAQESIVKFSALLQDSIWATDKPEKLTPQIVAMKAIELTVLSVRKSRNAVDLLLTETELLKILSIGGDPLDKAGGWHDPAITQLAFSILEAASTSKQQQALWSKAALQKLAQVCSTYFAQNKTPTEYRNLPTLAIKLCMNLTNNRPEACTPFTKGAFTQPVIHCMVRGFKSLFAGTEQRQRTEILETLLLSLGVMINLAEFSDVARGSCDDKSGTIRCLVEIFLEGSERAAQADSMEESQSSVAVGYLSVLLGNLCLHVNVRAQVCKLLPDQRLDFLIDKIKEFVHFHEQIASKSKQYEGEEGEKTWQNYTARLLHVVEKLES